MRANLSKPIQHWKAECYNFFGFDKICYEIKWNSAKL